MNYKKIYDLEYTDLFMDKCCEVSRNEAHNRKWAKRQANKKCRRTFNEIPDDEPVIEYTVTIGVLIDGVVAFDPNTQIVVSEFYDNNDAEEYIKNMYFKNGIALEYKPAPVEIMRNTFSTFDKSDFESDNIIIHNLTTKIL